MSNSSEADSSMGHPIIPLPVEISEIKLEVDEENSQTRTFLGFPISSRISQLEQQLEEMRNATACLRQEFDSVREISQRIESNWNTALDVDLNEDVQNLFNTVEQAASPSPPCLSYYGENFNADGTHSEISGNASPWSSSDREINIAQSQSPEVKFPVGVKPYEVGSEPMACIGDTGLSSDPGPSISKRARSSVPKIFRKGTRSSPRFKTTGAANEGDAKFNKVQEVSRRTENILTTCTTALDVELNQDAQGGPNLHEVREQGTLDYAPSYDEVSNAGATHSNISGNSSPLSSSGTENIPAQKRSSVVEPLVGPNPPETCSEPMDITDSGSLSSIPGPPIPQPGRSDSKILCDGSRSSPSFQMSSEEVERIILPLIRPISPYIGSETMDWSDDHVLSSGPGPSNAKPIGGSMPNALGEAAPSSSIFQETDEPSAEAMLSEARNESTHAINVDASKGGSGFFCICGKTYANRANLLRHIRVSTQDWKFKCAECNVDFFFHHELKYHIAKHHKSSEHLKKDNAWGCSKCGKVFSSQLLFHRHQSRTHVSTVGLRMG